VSFFRVIFALFKAVSITCFGFRKIFGDANLILALDMIDNEAKYSLKQKKLLDKYDGHPLQTPAIVLNRTGCQ